MLSKFYAAAIAVALSLSCACEVRADGPISGPSDPQTVTLYNDGVTLINQGKTVQAAEKFRAAIARSPNFAEAHSNLGTALVQMGKYQEAFPELKKATELKPDSGPSWGTLGTCYQTLGNTAEAVKAFKMFIKLQPHAPEIATVKSTVATLENELKRTSGQAPEDINAADYLGDATQNGMSRWPKSRMPITVNINADPTVPGFNSEYVPILKAAFEDWQNASKGLVQFKFDTSADAAEIKCKWTEDPKLMISSSEGGHAMVIPDSDGIISVDIILLTQPPVGLKTMTPNYAKRIYLHEIGHALGLLGHSKGPNDIMFSSIPPADVPSDLTERDKNTLVALYSMSDADIASHPLNMTRMALSGDPSSGGNQLIKLNAEGAEALKNGNFPLAIQKFEAAKRLDPKSELLAHNLGSAYANTGMFAATARNWPLAEEYFKKAIPLLEHSPEKQALVSVLKAYQYVLNVQHKTAESAKIDERLKSLGTH